MHSSPHLFVNRTCAVLSAHVAAPAQLLERAADALERQCAVLFDPKPPELEHSDPLDRTRSDDQRVEQMRLRREAVESRLKQCDGILKGFEAKAAADAETKHGGEAEAEVADRQCFLLAAVGRSNGNHTGMEQMAAAMHLGCDENETYLIAGNSQDRNFTPLFFEVGQMLNAIRACCPCTLSVC